VVIVDTKETRGIPAAELVQKTGVVGVHQAVVGQDIAAESGEEGREDERAVHQPV
jgi:hypothetical protein